MVLAGAGVGGGSLVYGNTLYEPLPSFFTDARWSHITDWRAELSPFYDLAKRMLGVVTYPTLTPADEVMRAVAEEMGVADTFVASAGRRLLRRARGGGRRPVLRRRRPGPHGLHRVRRVHDRLPPRRQEHSPQELPLPGRARRRQGLPAHDRHGPPASPRRPLRGHDRALRGVGAQAPEELRRHRRRAGGRDDGHPEAAPLHARRGQAPQPLAPARRAHPFELRGDPRGAHLPAAGVDFTRGVAITSSFYPDEQTHIEPVRYGRGSNAMGLLATALADGGGRSRAATWAREVLRSPGDDAAQPEPAPLVRADDRRPRHAAAGQLDDLLHGRSALRPAAQLADRATASRTRPGSRSATRSCGVSPGASAASPPAAGTTSSTSP